MTATKRKRRKATALQLEQSRVRQVFARVLRQKREAVINDQYDWAMDMNVQNALGMVHLALSIGIFEPGSPCFGRVWDWVYSWKAQWHAAQKKAGQA